ncbi:retrovirus-related Pol polyprotein from transposon 297 [Trichonephila clavipes]|nr:retrovirus-related Pol polyprotein from transposon 297 [Trichonephila clavipes]
MCYFRHIGLLDDQQETSESQMNCSLMMSPELSDEQRNKPSELLRNFRAFHEDRQVDSREDECEKHRIFTGDHAQLKPTTHRVSLTERRIIHEEVQKMLDEGIVQPLKVLVITHCARKKKDGSWRFASIIAPE